MAVVIGLPRTLTETELETLREELRARIWPLTCELKDSEEWARCLKLSFRRPTPKAKWPLWIALKAALSRVGIEEVEGWRLLTPVPRG